MLIVQLKHPIQSLDVLHDQHLHFQETYVHEHTLKQIAQIMGEKESTVGSRLTRGRKKLMQLLVGRGYHD